MHREQRAEQDLMRASVASAYVAYAAEQVRVGGRVPCSPYRWTMKNTSGEFNLMVCKVGFSICNLTLHMSRWSTYE
jgi:hypothetical protein